MKQGTDSIMLIIQIVDKKKLMSERGVIRMELIPVMFVRAFHEHTHANADDETSCLETFV